jgi:hypothetical protein
VDELAWTQFATARARWDLLLPTNLSSGRVSGDAIRHRSRVWDLLLPTNLSGGRVSGDATRDRSRVWDLLLFQTARDIGPPPHDVCIDAFRRSYRRRGEISFDRSRRSIRQFSLICAVAANAALCWISRPMQRIRTYQASPARRMHCRLANEKMQLALRAADAANRMTRSEQTPGYNAARPVTTRIILLRRDSTCTCNHKIPRRFCMG